MAERIIPFQNKTINNGEKTSVVERLMEESKTLDKWQLFGGTLAAAGSVLVPIAAPILAPIAAGTLGTTIVSHELTRDDLRTRREKRFEKAREELQKAA